MTESVDTVYFFKTFAFESGQKIHIDDGPRRGDWLVVEVDATHVTLRCPISGKQFRWPLFCYVTDTRRAVWPQSG